MRTGYISLFVLLFTVTLSAQSTTLFDLYKIPTYSYNRLSLYAQDFLYYRKANNLDEGSSHEDASARFGLNNRFVDQSPMVTSTIYTSFNFEYRSSNSIRQDFTSKGEDSRLYLDVLTTNSWYLTNENGIFIFADPSLGYYHNLKEDYNRSIVKIPAGLGYGRVIGLKSAVQAYIIADEIDAALSEESILKLAEVLDKYDGGFYSKFKDDGEIEFYKDITGITGKPDDVFKIKQVISSGLYKTTERFSGAQVKLGTNVYYMNKEQWEYSGLPDYSTIADFFASVEYALPISFYTQFTSGLTYSHNYDTGRYRAPKLSAAAAVSFMHSYNWKTELSAEYSCVFPNDQSWPVLSGPAIIDNSTLETRQYIELYARTEFAFLNTLSAFISLEYMKFDFSGDNKFNPITYPSGKIESIQFHMGFYYYIM